MQSFDGNGGQLQSELLRHGELNWVTRGVYLGDQRNYLAINIDDVFLSDDSWDTATHTTDYNPADAIRMTPRTSTGRPPGPDRTDHAGHAVQRRRQRCIRGRTRRLRSVAQRVQERLFGLLLAQPHLRPPEPPTAPPRHTPTPSSRATPPGPPRTASRPTRPRLSQASTRASRTSCPATPARSTPLTSTPHPSPPPAGALPAGSYEYAVTDTSSNGESTPSETTAIPGAPRKPTRPR